MCFTLVCQGTRRGPGESFRCPTPGQTHQSTLSLSRLFDILKNEPWLFNGPFWRVQWKKSISQESFFCFNFKFVPPLQWPPPPPDTRANSRNLIEIEGFLINCCKINTFYTLDFKSVGWNSKLPFFLLLFTFLWRKLLYQNIGKYLSFLRKNILIFRFFFLLDSMLNHCQKYRMSKFKPS